MYELAFVLAGFTSGIFSGGLGIGGSAVATPLVRLLGLSPYLAVGTPVPMILPSTITGSILYLRADMVDRRAAAWTAPAAAVAAFAGALATRAVDGSILMLFCAGILLFLSMRLFPRALGAPAPEGPAVAGPWGYLALGTATGFLSGLLGVGGGFLMVPVFIKLFHMPTKTAVGTSLAVIALTVIPNGLGHALAHNIDWKAAALLCLGVIPGARLGALMAIRSNERVLRTVMSVALSLVALTYAGSEIMKMANR